LDAGESVKIVKRLKTLKGLKSLKRVKNVKIRAVLLLEGPRKSDITNLRYFQLRTPEKQSVKSGQSAVKFFRFLVFGFRIFTAQEDWLRRVFPTICRIQFCDTADYKSALLPAAEPPRNNL
jgi:hypothetical protein